MKYLKKFEMVKLERCERCGGILFDDDYDFCYKCRSGEPIEDIDIDDEKKDKKELPEFGIRTTPSQNIYYL